MSGAQAGRQKSEADARAATTVKERLEKAAGIDERLGFREKDGLSQALKGIGKIVGLAVAVGGCAELRAQQ